MGGPGKKPVTNAHWVWELGTSGVEHRSQTQGLESERRDQTEAKGGAGGLGNTGRRQALQGGHTGPVPEGGVGR